MSESSSWMHLTVILIVAIIAMVSVTAMLLKGNADAAKEKSLGFNREFGSFCTDNSQCMSGVCGGSITMPNGKVVPNVKVCI